MPTALWGGFFGNHGRGYQGYETSGQGQTPKNARYISNIACRDEKSGHLMHLTVMCTNALWCRARQ